MPYTTKWYIEDEIIYTRYFGMTTAEEMHDSLIETKEFIERSPRAVVHILIDVGDITEHVVLKDSMKIIREVGPHPRAGWTIIVREKSPIIRMGAGMGASVFRLRLKTFDTIDQALDHLKFFDQAISWNKAEEAILSR